jgi:hypothetical protein
MATAANAVQDQMLESITTMQEATLKVFKGWTDTLSSAPTLAELYNGPKLDSFYGFADKLWNTEKDFFVRLLEVTTEAGKKIPEAAKKTAERNASTATK